MNIITAERLRALREDNDYTQREIANLLKCSQVSYSHYEIGRRDIPLDHLITLSEFYGVSVDYILGVTDSKQRYPETAAPKNQ
ncbi:MAG: helix-turn-helix transcriptional regulator [Oscillospiraceae bacterium]|nr:helix-turn-helix domain-containing protein [Oscillospiraceae bacterium]MCI7498683.1 helix-turn-helix domain-containing protein [Oscillospiraceae bacterium]MDD7279773.1 helix-turn-helix transcriptional regulator [Oscillospiraceae bacterium]MDY2863019.1 helix-turn-helix transcriptional regulator [Oscillospiraceae bacterium]